MVLKSGFVKRLSMVTRVQKVVVTAVLAVSAVVGLSGSTAGAWSSDCLLYTSDAADEGLGVDLGGRRII